jgi:hypothetical protein
VAGCCQCDNKIQSSIKRAGNFLTR